MLSTAAGEPLDCDLSSFVCVKVMGGGSIRRFHVSVPVGQIKHYPAVIIIIIIVIIIKFT